MRAIDAFPSYAHEDQVAASWLANLLGTFWIPGRRRRNVFRDATHLTAEGSLKANIRSGVDGSRWLIVLSSQHSAASDWVNREIAHFLARPSENGFEARKRVLLCRVGDPSDQVVPALARPWGVSADGPLVPDLRGSMPPTDAAQRQRQVREALSLLAPFVGVSSNGNDSLEVPLDIGYPQASDSGYPRYRGYPPTNPVAHTLLAAAQDRRHSWPSPGAPHERRTRRLVGATHGGRVVVELAWTMDREQDRTLRDLFGLAPPSGWRSR